MKFKKLMFVHQDSSQKYKKEQIEGLNMKQITIAQLDRNTAQLQISPTRCPAHTTKLFCHPVPSLKLDSVSLPMSYVPHHI
jgi:hypothetical protein